MNKLAAPNYVYVNSTGQDLSAWHKEIVAALKATGALPEDFTDVFVVSVACTNPDGSPRYVIEMA